MQKMLRYLLILTIGLVLPFHLMAITEGNSPSPSTISASNFTTQSSPVKVKLLQEEETIQPNRPFWIALHLNLEEGWHVYWKNPGDAGMPLKVEWTLPAGFEAGPLEWPFPEKFTVAEMVGFGYKGEVILLSQVTPPAQLDPQAEFNLKAQIKWLVCSSLTCQPGSASVELPLKLSSQQPQLRNELVSFFKEAREKIPRTIVEVKTSHKEGIVQLEVPQQSPTSKVNGVDFFPEQKNVIDHSIEPTVAESSTKSNRYLVNLKGGDEIGAGSKKLKGVLVLHTQIGSEESIQAIDIDTQIEEEGDGGILSFFNRSQTSIGDEAIILDSSSPFSFEGGVTLALIFAFVGGMILNLMPCVLPVMSFKVMSFVKMAGKSRSLTLKHGAVFALGVILSFWILASAMLILRAYGQAVGWGFQLQEPLFVVFLASVLFVFSLSLFGLFEWGMFFASWAGETQVEKAKQSTGYTGSFFNGVLATAVATPCTGPFLGSAVGFAVTLPIFKSLLIFTSLGFGMSFPYLLLAAFPSFLRFIPKPGAWMETFKQLMGFLLMATVLWLLWVFSAETDAFSLVCLLAGFLCFSIGAWVYGRGCSPIIPRSKRVVSYVFVLLFAIMGCQAILFPRASWYNQDYLHSSLAKSEWEGWEDFSPERLAQLQREGKPVLIDFTAKWCLICQANHLVLTSDNVKQQLDLSGVVKMKADWTKNDPVITEALSKYGRNSVPLYVLHVPNQKPEPIILPQVLTADVVLEHLNSAIPPEEVALK